MTKDMFSDYRHWDMRMHQNNLDTNESRIIIYIPTLMLSCKKHLVLVPSYCFNGACNILVSSSAFVVSFNTISVFYVGPSADLWGECSNVTLQPARKDTSMLVFAMVHALITMRQGLGKWFSNFFQ